MGFDYFQVSKAGAPFRHPRAPTSKAKRADVADPSCATGSFYTSPTLAASYDSMNPLSMTWQPSLNCLLPTPSLVDIYLYAPGQTNPRLHIWEGVPYAPGNYSAELMPRWWNSSSSINLQVMLVPTNSPPFLSPIPAGPVFTATYTATTSGALAAAADPSLTGQDTGKTVVTPPMGAVSSHHLSKGATAAAVLLPLLFVLLLVAAYLKVSRARGAAQRSAWSEKLDKRMSTISQDWKAITPGGAREAVRHSLAVSRHSFSFGATDASSDVDAPAVVMGEKPPRVSAEDLPRTSLGSGVGVGVGARRPKTHASPPDRQSRAVSFAESAHPRPSMTGTASVYSRTSRAFHTASTYGDAEGDAPPVPALPSPSRVSAYGNTGDNRGQSVYVQGGAWSSGERVEGVDGGYGAQSVSPTGRVHTINYPVYDYAGNHSTSNLSHYSNENGHGDYDSYGTDGGNGNGAYENSGDANASYFSPVTPTPNSAFPSADSAYNANTYDAFGSQETMTSPKQTAGPLTLTPDDIRRRMTRGAQAQPEWRQSVDEVFGALSSESSFLSPF
ncbi:hypothetical protein B0H17DRAFT_1148538 [Mycena rosella]|uniref:Uncharacterized protein n=1 Tax=Mycena rosella TaxID=1033263 RepID=A0AAD7CCW1_MYCRO|nr:hypothetical protein B0H17DRAFT_1148538 [Mycena rosella]